MRARMLGAALAVFAVLLLGPPARAQDETLRWGHLPLVADAPVDTVAWYRALDLEGKPVEAAPLEPALERGLQALARQGYPFAEARPGAFDLVDDRVVGTIQVRTGSQPRIAAVELDGAKVTRSGTAMRIAGLSAGQPYTGAEEAAVQERMARSGLFTSVGDVQVVPGETEDEVILKVPVREPSYTQFRGALGVSGPESELTGLVDLKLGNIAGTGRIASGRWENRGGGLTRFGLHYHEPWLPFVPIALDFDLAHDLNQVVYTYTRWAVAASYTWKNQWYFTAGLGGAQAVEPGNGLGASNERFTLFGIGFDHRNSALTPTGGFKIYTETRRGSKTYPVTDTTSVKVNRERWAAGFEAYRRVSRPWLLSVRSRFDVLQTPEAVIPRYELYAIGGATTLRGYREEQFLTPMAWVVQGEWSLLVGERGSRLFWFTDVGFLGAPEARELGRIFDQVPVGMGVGVSQASRLGVLGVEYGFAKGENVLDGRIHLTLDARF